MKKRLSGVMFGALFCAWVLTAILGLGIAAVSSLNLIYPEGATGANDNSPFGPPPKRSSSAMHLALGVVMVLWPLPFCRKAASESAVDGFGRE
jgi:hypothetical protein